MITNLLATILIVVTTNTYSPLQYKVESGIMFLNGQSWEAEWQDEKPLWAGTPPRYKTRDNPDVRITEVLETRWISFKVDDIEITQALSMKRISIKKEKRVVKSEEKWVEENQ